ncbi:dihydrodipicolinate synthase family protein [Microbacterium luticocti]|uniref:dihydrodipicolinate synthase family protein n=1 Tax=Microbacterium luticocti TaxID=451764 RepID=UPI0003FBF8DE|nr:dihydrodipicolinate synthase family protein [Microbacterium luticocti]
MTASTPALFTGVVPPVATPLLPGGEVDTASLRRLVDHLIASGVDGLFALGSTGETAYFTNAQRVQILTTIVDAAAGRVPVIAGAIELTAGRVIECARQLVDAGADAIVTTGPLYTINSRDEVADHFRTIAAALPVPLWAYDVPVRVHSKLPLEMVIELGREGVISGIKDSSGDDVGFRRLIAANQAAGHPLQVFTGHEVVVDAMLLAGADGVVPGLANVEAAGYVRLWQAAQRGDWETARTEQERINRLFEIVFQPHGRSGDAAGVGAFKTAMAELGLIDHAVLAAPVQPLDAATVAKVRTILRDLELVA